MTPILSTPLNSRITAELITAAESAKMHRNLPISYTPSEKFTLLDVLVMQFWIHLILNTRTGPEGIINDYSGKIVHGLGLYPQRKDAIMLTGDHYFALSDRGLPYVTLNGTNGIKRPWISGDPARSSENPGLSCLHYLFALISNKLRRTEDLNYEEGKAMTMAVVSNLLHGTFAKYGIDASDKPTPPSRWRNLNVVNTLDFAFGWGRVTHGQVPSLASAPGLFVPVDGESSLDLYALSRADSIPANKLGYTITDSMEQMTHIKAPPHDIRQRTGAQAHSHAMATYEQLGEVLGLKPTYKTTLAAPHLGDSGQMPSWLGILAESDDDKLGPIGFKLLELAAQQSFDCQPNELIFARLPDERLYASSIQDLIEFAEED